MAIEATGGVTIGFMPGAGSAVARTNHGSEGNDQAAVRRQDGAEYLKLANVAKAAVQTETKRDQTSQDRVKEASQMLNDFMKQHAIELQFKIEDGETVVKVMNKQTGDLIRQIPSEETIRLSKALDTLQGMIIQQKV